MEAHSSSSNSSSSSSSSMYVTEYPREQTKSFIPSLHSIRKPMAKPWKKPIAPLPPTPPKVYRVDPVNFRDLVQKLTGAPVSQRLHSVAPPPLDLAGRPALFSREVTSAVPLQLLKPSPTLSSPFTALNTDLSMSETVLDAKHKILMDRGVGSSSCELKLSPSSHGWCSFPLLSPGTLSSLEQSTVL
ncbi:hypothetical protein K2173_014783 [Erythroxylum novogranatense]|uniref:VQ domain-containing protein n=1 Tax=Erythroxylum novogranatense TaxID=1862640 RepID=A0AAV8TGX5_9ROSI|nr:hypothetical protein K2173_014783 [Erythroxylum novogranatense]